MQVDGPHADGIRARATAADKANASSPPLA
jgi:hypothetical protein